MNTINMIGKFWEDTENSTSVTSLLVLKWLNYDNLGAIIKDKDIFWIEMTNSNATLPKYVLSYIKKWAKKYHMTYLYDIKVNN